MKKLIKKLHLYLALILCIPLVIQGLTGAILVFQKNISEHYLKKEHNFVEGEIRDSGLIIEAAQKAVPEDFSASFVRLPVEEMSPATVRFTKSGEKKLMLEVIIDPVSLQVVKVQNPEDDILRLIKKFHASLLIPGDAGKTTVGIFGFVLLFMAISGLILWWPKHFKFKRSLTFKFSTKGRKFYRDMHNAVGFWTSALLLITSFTGIYLTFTPATTRFILAIFPGENLRSIASEIRVRPDENALDFESVLSLADSAMSRGEELISVSIPNKKDLPYRLNFSPRNYQDGEPLIAVFLDQFQQEVVVKHHPNSFSLGEKIIAWQHALHAGEGLGILWKLSVFLTGFLPLLFAITGITMWWKKKKEKAERSAHTKTSI